ncbi:hypothetical protein FZC74_05110 [Sutcliffiella horikoshii]|uniref:Uncharacterized protein n=1 Tax=Sutcliffiella horikoshii TaxID=79883 RepID=A0AA94WRU4_9BACI|nr:hypothetical protein FZC74_05110 [Sutcliffiella horikoshii]
MRPLKRCEEAQTPSRGKRSHLRKGTAGINQSIKKPLNSSYYNISCIPILSYVIIISNDMERIN